MYDSISVSFMVGLYFAFGFKSPLENVPSVQRLLQPSHFKMFVRFSCLKAIFCVLVMSVCSINEYVVLSS